MLEKNELKVNWLFYKWALSIYQVVSVKVEYTQYFIKEGGILA